MIELGKEVRDTVSGFEGIAVSRCEYISGVAEIGVRAKAGETRPQVEYIEEALLEVIGDGITVKREVKPMGFGAVK